MWVWRNEISSRWGWSSQTPANRLDDKSQQIFLRLVTLLNKVAIHFNSRGCRARWHKNYFSHRFVSCSEHSVQALWRLRSGAERKIFSSFINFNWISVILKRYRKCTYMKINHVASDDIEAMRHKKWAHSHFVVNFMRFLSPIVEARTRESKRAAKTLVAERLDIWPHRSRNNNLQKLRFHIEFDFASAFVS